jgi:signal transduction histidine kinase
MNAEAFLQETAAWIGLGPADTELLASLHEQLAPSFPGIVESFYAHIAANPTAKAVLRDDEQLARLKCSMIDWLHGLFAGRIDAAYVEGRARIGQRHVQVGLPQRYMFTAMHEIQHGLVHAIHQVADREGWTHDDCLHAEIAVGRVCMLELAIMLETYAEADAKRLGDAARLAAIGQIAATIGHELRNPLAVIESSRMLLERSVGGDDRAKRHLGRISEQVALSTAIIEGLLELARDREPRRASTDLGALLDEVARSAPTAGEVTVDVVVPTDFPRAQVDATQIRQLASNLVVNACQALRERGRGGGRVLVLVDRRADLLVLRVEDDGPGLGEDVQRRLFEPLFTTRPTGTGLGLALCRRIAEKHGGEIAVVPSTLGGAAFEATLARSFPITVVMPDETGEPIA